LLNFLESSNERVSRPLECAVQNPQATDWILATILLQASAFHTQSVY